MQEPMLKLDSDLSRTLGFTSEYFEAGTIYNLLPVGVYISWLTPKNDKAIDQMFDIIDQRKLRFRYSAPQPQVWQKLVARGYWLARDKAGTPYFCNFTPKKNVVSLVRPLTMEKLI